MPTSATGTWSSPTPLQRGFTLIEVMVVMLIVAVMVAGTALSIGLARGDRELDNERERLLGLAGYLREQASLQSREYGIRCFDGGYEFLVYSFDLTTGQFTWQRLQGDELLSPRHLPEGLKLEVAVDGRRIKLPEEDVLPDELAPQIMLFSTGELNLFEITLRRDSTGKGVRIAPSPVEDRIEASPLAADSI